MQTVAIIDYGSGNLHSAQKAFERVVAEADLPFRVLVTQSPADVARADRIVLPGVGAFSACRTGLAAVEGLEEALSKTVLEAKRPFLGICVGMQLMADGSEEFGYTPGLGWIAGTVRAIEPGDPACKVPHMGWNRVTAPSAADGAEEKAPRHPVPPHQAGDGAHAYFVHSYHMQPADPAHVLAVTHHGGRIVAAVGRDNMIGVQFHPEKSQAYGLSLIRNFLSWEPER